MTNFGGEAINSSDELVAAVQSHKVGDQVQLTYSAKRIGKDRNRDAH